MVLKIKLTARLIKCVPIEGSCASNESRIGFNILFYFLNTVKTYMHFLVVASQLRPRVVSHPPENARLLQLSPLVILIS